MKIGVFDSGIGGISVLCALVKEKPYNDYYYLGDNLNAPYGDKTENELKTLADKNIKVLLEYGVDIIVVACNTVSTTCKKYILKKYNKIPFCFITPQITKKILKDRCVVFCTEKTANNLKKTKKYITKSDNICIVGCSGLVEKIERNFFNFNSQFLNHYCKGIGQDIKSVVLGCTHYPLIATFFREKFPLAKFYDGTKPLIATLTKIERKNFKNINLVNAFYNGKIFFLGNCGAQNYRIYATFSKKITKSGKNFTKSGWQLP